ncbi:MAG: ABC transporter permease, partial [Clostridiales bacterium]
MDNLVNIIVAAVLAGTPLLFGTLGEILTEKSGNLNLGVEGMMFMGALAGLAGVYFPEMWFGEISGGACFILAVLFSFLCGAFGAAIYGFLTITLRAQQNVTGLALTMFGIGFGNFFGEVISTNSANNYMVISSAAKVVFGNTPIWPFLARLGEDSQVIYYINKLFFSYNPVVYLGLILAVLMMLFLNHTRIGLNLRAVGEDPATADAAGINVDKYKYLATIIGGGICGIGGMYISLVT